MHRRNPGEESLRRQREGVASDDDLDPALGRLMTSDLASVRDRLRQQARSVARETEINRRVLRARWSRETGSSTRSAAAHPPGRYEPGETAGASGALLNRQV